MARIAACGAIRQGRKQPAQPVEEPKRVTHRRSGASRAYTQPAAESTGKVYVDSALSGGTSPEMRAPVTYEENQAEGQNTESYDRPGRRSYGRKAARVQPVGAHAAKRRGNVHKVTRHMINWAHMAIAMACLAVLLMVGAYFYLTHTAEGQRIMARRAIRQRPPPYGKWARKKWTLETLMGPLRISCRPGNRMEEETQRGWAAAAGQRL